MSAPCLESQNHSGLNLINFGNIQYVSMVCASCTCIVRFRIPVVGTNTHNEYFVNGPTRGGQSRGAQQVTVPPAPRQPARTARPRRRCAPRAARPAARPPTRRWPRCRRCPPCPSCPSCPPTTSTSNGTL